MKDKKINKLWLPFAALGLALSLYSSAFAIGIQPIRYEVNLEPGESSTGEIKVINETEKDFSAEPVIKVFHKNDETGFPVYPTGEDLELEDIRSWINIPTEPILIPAGESKVVQYTINVPQNAEAGGKYMTIAYQPAKGTNGGVAVNVRAASLLFINVAGDVIKKGEITYFGLPKEVKTDEPFVFDLTFKNTGNTHIKPHGWIKIINKETGEALKGISQYTDVQSAQEVTGDEIPLNLRQTNVLPDSIRTFKSEWLNAIQEGSFQAVVNLEYDKEAGPISQTFDFDIKEEMTIDELVINAGETSANFDVTLTNHGNFYEKPQGVIKIVNNLGYQVAEVPLSQDMKYLAPGETVSFNLAWLNKALPTGRYTAMLELSYGFTHKTANKEISFGQADKTKLYMGIGLAFAILIAFLAIFTKRRKKE